MERGLEQSRILLQMFESTPIQIPAHLIAAREEDRDRGDWVRALPGAVRERAHTWSLRLEKPYEGPEVSCAWVAPAVRADGAAAVLKLGMPHFEAQHEIEGLRYWDGDPTVRLLAYDLGCNAMLLERCRPGTHLNRLPEPEQDVVLAGLLRRLWSTPRDPHPFRPLADMTAYWAAETEAAEAKWADAGLVREGLRLFDELNRSSRAPALLATDLHAGNVLRAEREPWLVIDPKPFIGDPAYDATQHLFNCRERLLADSGSVIARFADLLQLGTERIQLWAFARAAAAPRSDWSDVTLARKLSRALT